MISRVRSAVNSPDAQTAEHVPHWMQARIFLNSSCNASSSTMLGLKDMSFVVIGNKLPVVSNFVFGLYEAIVTI